MTAHPSESCLHLGDLELTLTAPEAWAHHQHDYLTGYLPGRLGDEHLAAFRMEVHPDDEQCEKVVEAANRPPITRHFEPVPGVVMTETRTPNGTRNYAITSDSIEQQPHAYAVRVHERTIELYLHSSARRPHTYPLRLMREAMMRSYEDHGATVFHAAGADLNGHGAMIIGPRSAGKTTLLTCLLRATGGALLSNDRLLVGDQQRLIAVPMPVPIARGTLPAVPELAAAAGNLSRVQPSVRTLPATFGTRRKAQFSAAEYATALGTSLAAGSWLRTILIPRMTDTTEPASVRILAPEQARQALKASCFTPRDEFWQQPWITPRTSPDAVLQHRADLLVREITETIPCAEIRFGIGNPLTDLQHALEGVVA